jgi:hypothetical protein
MQSVQFGTKAANNMVLAWLALLTSSVANGVPLIQPSKIILIERVQRVGKSFFYRTSKYLKAKHWIFYTFRIFFIQFGEIDSRN